MLPFSFFVYYFDLKRAMFIAVFINKKSELSFTVKSK